MLMRSRDQRFDDIARDVAAGTSRRQGLGRLGAGLAGGLPASRGPAWALAERDGGKR